MSVLLGPFFLGLNKLIWKMLRGWGKKTAGWWEKKLLADPPFRIPSWNQARVGTKTQKKTKKSSVIITIKCKNKNKNQIFFIHNTTFLQEILLSVWFQWPSHTSILVWMNVCIYVWCMHMHAYTPPSLLSLPPLLSLAPADWKRFLGLVLTFSFGPSYCPSPLIVW